MSKPMLHVSVLAACPRPCHAACPCSSCLSMPMLHVHVHVHSAICMSVSMLHGHVHFACLCPCCKSMFMSPYPSPFCTSMSTLHDYVHAACPCPCCISVSVYILHVRVQAPYPSSWYMAISMLHVHVHVYAACPYRCPSSCCICIYMYMHMNINTYVDIYVKLSMPELVRHQTKPTHFDIFLVQYQTDLRDAGMPMPALVSSMPMSSYVLRVGKGSAKCTLVNVAAQHGPILSINTYISIH
jgi:hypothetical protein